jgi:hypothetical protein
MVITKKSTKGHHIQTPAKQTTKSSKKHEKSNRGRPKKEFKLKHKRVQETQHSKLHETITPHTMPKVGKILQFPNKDKSILYLFIFSVILFILSLGISFIKKQKLAELKETQIQSGTNVQMQNIASQTENTPQPQAVTQLQTGNESQTVTELQTNMVNQQ